MSGPAFDILTSAGFAIALNSCLRLMEGGIAPFGPTCGSWIWLCRSGPCTLSLLIVVHFHVFAVLCFGMPYTIHACTYIYYIRMCDDLSTEVIVTPKLSCATW